MSDSTEKSPFYITTAIPYVNGAPHVGFALELVQADTLARHSRQQGREVRFLSGTDDNSLKNVRAAAALGIPTEKLVKTNANAFEELREVLSFSCDDFIRNWGVSVPGDLEQVIYVWFDALGNYITALDYASDGPLFCNFWSKNASRNHVIGKGITRFHAVDWPAILLSAGLPLPSRILVHGYLTVEGRKIGKSIGNSISPRELVERFGTDALRHYLLHHFRSTQDGDFSVERLISAHNTELADKLGNLLSRTLALVQRHCAGTIPSPGSATDTERQLLRA